uniref:DNA topoisomerase 4 subunit B n=1 Tax=uncultured Mycoplasmataceae bacterium TaxID=300027 RepID=A0A6G9HGX0_9MOLU|nr:DNA topoisomerase IV subunit B [uncultured Mycoplasmataceae bacterium]
MQGYKDDNIKVLEGLEPVRKRPGMYIGSTDIHGLHHLVWEVFDNAIDEVISGNADTIRVTLHKDNSITVKDNGRGIPIGINSTTKLSTIDTVFTVLHAGGKFDDNAYKTSGGLHGVGASVVNALSEWLIVTVNRDNKVVESKYEHGGKIVQPTKVVGTTNRTGTTVTFKPDPLIFKNVTFNPSVIKERIRESSFLYKNLKIIFEDEINKETTEYYSTHGISEYVSFINDNKTTITNIASFSGVGSDNIEIDIALQYTNDTSDIIVSFANSVKTSEGGSHETGFKSALTECLNNYGRKWNLLKEKDKNFEGEDAREGLTAVISVRVPEKIIAYEGQTKNKLFTQEAVASVKKFFGEHFTFWLEENKKDAIKIVQKALLSRDARIAAKKAREDTKKIKNTNQTLLLSGKLTPAQSKQYSENELFLVEGDSAGGTAKLARNKRHQAILPLKGKILNVEKARLRDLLANEEICTIISSLGAGIGNDFKIENLKYDKVVIMTDADTDGAHIQVLLLTFFYRFMRPLIEKGHVYVALPPLFRIASKLADKKIAYAWNEQDLEEQKHNFKSYEVQRYKGLGEMSAEQLWETTMNPDTRLFLKVSIQDAVLAERRVNILMGDNSQVRKEWINNNVDFTLDE